MSTPLVAIVGRPNVGKSTLFNRIIGTRRAIVHDVAGVTRDRHYAETEWAGRGFILIDTGGYVPDSADVFVKAIREQVAVSVEEAAVVLFLVDGQEGLHPMDHELAQMLRRSKRTVLLAVNKVDGERQELETGQFYALGLGEPIPVSAISGRSSGDLLDLVVKGFPEAAKNDDEAGSMRLAVIGRPNVGKSSLVNALIGTERSIVTDVPGTTRDSLDTPMRYKGRNIVIVDTAGLRRRSKVKENIEFFSTIRTLKSVEQCDVALCLIDASGGLTHQDIDIVSGALEHKKGAVIAVNKWDLIEKDSNTAIRVERDIRERIKTYDFVPVITISATNKQRVRKALDIAVDVYEERRKRVPTSELNDGLLEVLQRTPPPATPTGREVKISYATQVREAPPVFVLFANEPKHIPESYRRFVERSIRGLFGFTGAPIVVQFRNKRQSA